MPRIAVKFRCKVFRHNSIDSERQEVRHDKGNNRLLAYLLIIAGLFILIGKWISFGTFVALFMLYLGISKVKCEELRLGYTLLGIGEQSCCWSI